MPDIDKPLKMENEAEDSKMPLEFEPLSQWEVVPKSACVIPPRTAMVDDSENQEDDSEDEGMLPSAMVRTKNDYLLQQSTNYCIMLTLSHSPLV